MSFSGALGRGTYQAVIAGAVRRSTPSYYAGALELAQLAEAHRDVQRGFAIRDAVFEPLFPEAAPLAGTYRLTPKQREKHHMYTVMRDIRKRTILLTRIRQQRQVNHSIAETRGAREPELSADAAAYFAPQHNKATNNWPNFWQHQSANHVVPRPQWRRHAELGGITRVQQAPSVYAKSY